MLSSIFLAHQCNTHDLAIFTSHGAKDVVFSIWRVRSSKRRENPAQHYHVHYYMVEGRRVIGIGSYQLGVSWTDVCLN